MELESADELKWSLCRVFNKQTYYAIRRHLTRTVEKPLFTELTSHDVYRMFWDVCWPSYFQPDDKHFVVLKIDGIETKPTTRGRKIPEVVLETKVLKTRHTRHIDAEIRKRTVRATGSLAALLSKQLKIADILVVCKNHLVPTANFGVFRWSKVKQRKLLLNTKKRPHKMIFFYRHDGQFNHRSWPHEMVKEIKDQNLRLKVRRIEGIEHGACVLIQPDQEFVETPLFETPETPPTPKSVETAGNWWDNQNQNQYAATQDWVHRYFGSQESMARSMFPEAFSDNILGMNSIPPVLPPPQFKVPEPRTNLIYRPASQIAAEKTQQPEPGPSSAKETKRAIVDGPAGSDTCFKRPRVDTQKRVTAFKRAQKPNSAPNGVPPGSKRVKTPWSTQTTIEFSSSDNG